MCVYVSISILCTVYQCDPFARSSRLAFALGRRHRRESRRRRRRRRRRGRRRVSHELE